MIIKILGTGCTKCQRLEQLTREVVAELGIDASFDHVRDMQVIMAYPVMTTPALVIDAEDMLFVRIRSKEEIAGWLKQAGSA